jgi:ABC-2 type transport system ATP-binding protein
MLARFMDTVIVSRVTKSFGSVQALRGLDLTFPSGGVGLLGPNGAGKSTLLKILLGLLTPDTGSTKVLGLDTATQAMEVRQTVGYMPEVDAYLPGLTGAQSVLFAGIMCGMSRRHAHQRAHEILYYVGLGEARYRKVQQYSTGMRQRLRMAQALIHDPELIFLDEPTNGLDPAGRDEVLQLIEDLTRRHNKTIVLCSHLLHDVEAVCDHVVLLQHGKVALSGGIEEVRKLERGVWRMRAYGDRPRLQEAFDKFGIELLEDDGEALQVRVPDDEGPRNIFRAARDAGAVVRELSTFHQSLTDVFVRAVENGD